MPTERPGRRPVPTETYWRKFSNLPGCCAGRMHRFARTMSGGSMSSYLRSSIHTALLAAAVGGSGVASAAEPQQTSFIEEIEIVVVTGSYIEGAADDAALPIDVLTAEDLAKQGSPSMVELIKTIPSVQGVVGESNQ